MSIARRILAALLAAHICLALASPALADESATVTVRVEGLTETKLAPTQVTTTLAPVVKDGNPEHACSGTGALGALALATAEDWSGPWNSEFKQYEIYSIEGETHVFEPASSANYYWSFWLDNRESEVGACEAQLHSGDTVLFFPACYGSACPPPSLPLGIEAPTSANAGEAVTVTVRRYASDGEGTPAAGASVTGGDTSATTDATGHAVLTFSHPGEFSVRASAPQSVRAEATICVHAGEDGTCGTTAPAPVGAAGAARTLAPAAAAPYTGPYALVAEATGLINGHVYPRRHAPRILSGRVLAHAPVTSVSLALRRRYRGHCYSYDGVRERFHRARCGRGVFFKVSSAASFSYLLPEALQPGRYVLDLEAADAAGNRSTLARGSSRIVFYVR